MKVLVTGARGLLGAAITREFAPHDELVAIDRRALDITDGEAIERVVSAARPDVLVNCAAYNDVDGAEEVPETALAVNAFAVSSLARTAARVGAILVHFSSDFVFDGESDRPYTEDDRTNPQGAYAASKLLGDWFALEAPRAYVLRVESLFGPPAEGGSRRGSLGTIVDRIRAGDEVPVFIDRTVSPSHTPDIARAVRSLVETQAAPGLYHCVSSGHATWATIAEAIARTLDMPLRMRPMTLASANLRARRPRYCALANDKLRAAGVDMPDWQTALRQFLVP